MSNATNVQPTDEYVIVDLQETRDGWFLWWFVEGKASTIELSSATVFSLEQLNERLDGLDNGLETMAVLKSDLQSLVVSVIPKERLKDIQRAVTSIRSKINAGSIPELLVMNEKAKQNAFDEHLLFWCPDGQGYTTSIEKAWACPWQRALNICQHGAVPVPIDIATQYAIGAVKKRDSTVRELRDQAVIARMRAAGVNALRTA